VADRHRPVPVPAPKAQYREPYASPLRASEEQLADRDQAFQCFHDALAENFSPAEILEIVVVVNMNVWTRIKLAKGATPGAA
jgi:hypothetical protein